ncbi:hypothetical protein C8R44DRAFT_735645 [Mycena epipterygia]|nr:hypothetical protein C8R44DRAFT_735645 [Mycena epipterygia]
MQNWHTDSAVSGQVLQRALLQLCLSKAQAELAATCKTLEQSHTQNKILHQAAQTIGSEGQEKKQKLVQADHDTQVVVEHWEHKKKANAKKAADIQAINKCKPIFFIEQFTNPTSLEDMQKPALNLQCKWHHLREIEVDKTEIPPLSGQA